MLHLYLSLYLSLSLKLNSHLQQQTHLRPRLERVIQLDEPFVSQFLHYVDLMLDVLLVLGPRGADKLGSELLARFSLLAAFHLTKLTPVEVKNKLFRHDNQKK